MSKNVKAVGVGNVLNYRALLSQTDAEIAVEQLDSNVEQASISFKQGLLSMESKLITAKSDVSAKESALKAAGLVLSIIFIVPSKAILAVVFCPVKSVVGINQAVFNIKNFFI